MSSLIIDPLAVTPTPPADPFSLLDPVKEEAKRRERADRIEAAVLNGVDSLMTPEQKASRADLDSMSADKGAASRQRMTHSMFLAGETGRPVQEIDEAYDYWKTLYARQYFEGVNAADEGAFGGKVKELVTKRRDFRVQTEAVYESGVRDALTLEPEDFMARASRLTDIYGSDTKLGPAEGQKLRETYLLARQQAEGKLAPLRPRAQQIWNELLKGTVNTGDEEEYDPMERIVTLLEDTPDNERPMLLQLLKSQAGDKVDDPFTMGVVRGFSNMMAGAGDQMDIRRIDGYLKDMSAAEPKVDAILNTPEKIMARMASGLSLITPGEFEAPRTRTLSPDEVQTLRAVFDRQVKRYDLASEARTIFEQNVQPIDMSGFAAELRSDVGGSIGAMAPMILPLAGVVIAQSGYANEEYLRQRKMGTDFSTAKETSELNGALYAGIERVSFLFNFVPTSALGKLSTMLLNGGGSPALVAGARGMAFGIGKRVTLTQGVEYTEEIAQAAVPLFTSAIAEPLGLDLPQQAQLSAELERFQADGGLWRPRVYAAVAALTLLPAGVRGVADTKQAREEVIARLADPDYATAMGIKPNSAVIIATMLPEDRLDAYLESFPARDTSTPAAKAAAESVARKEQEQGQWEQDQVTKAEAAGVRVRRTDAGTYEVQDTISGTTLSMATAGEASATMRHVMLERGLLQEERWLDAADKHIEMMRPGRTIDVASTETDLLKELERATADERDNDVVTIWERADQYRLSIGKEVLDRDRLNPDSRNALAEMAVFGNSVTAVREGVSRSISKVMAGGDSLDLLEEQAENDYREAVNNGKVTKETMKAIIVKLETATGDKYQFVDSDLGVTEAWSRIVRLYATGTRNNKGNAITKGARGDVAQKMRESRNKLRQAEAAITGQATGKKASDLKAQRRRLREAEANGVVPGAFIKLREYYDQAKAQLGQVARLMKARDAGQLDDLETMIRESVGLTEQDTYDSQLTKEMEATEATIKPPDSWTSSMSVGSRALPDIDAFAAADTETQMSFAISPRIYDHNKELRRPKPLREAINNEYTTTRKDNILYRPDRYYRVIDDNAWADFQDIGYFRPNPNSKVNDKGGYPVLYAATGGQAARYKGRYVLEVNPVEGQWTQISEVSGYVTTAIGSITKDSAVRVFEKQADGTYKVVLDNIGDQALFDPTEQSAGGYSVGSRAQPADSQEGSYSIKAAHDVLKSATAPALTAETKALPKVPVKTKSHLVEGIYRNLDAIFKGLGSPLESQKTWATFLHAITGSLNKAEPHLMAPATAMRYVKGEGLEFVTDDLLKHPEFAQAREEGLALATTMLRKFRSGELGRTDLAGLFAWGLLSRGVGAYYQEGAYLALHRAGLLDKIEQVFTKEMTPDDLTTWGLSKLKSSPGVSSSHNVKALGNQMEALGTIIDGRPAIDILLDAWKSNMTGPELRRTVFALFTDDRPSVQIQNKVLSFIILVSGRPDVLVMDRIQFRHLWGGAEVDEALVLLSQQVAQAKVKTAEVYGAGSEEARLALAVSSDPDNIYDSLPVIAPDGTFKFKVSKGNAMVETNGIFKVGNGLHGMSLYEALEQALHEPVRKAYVDNGISYPGIGAFHWDSWLVTSQQAISHPTLAVIAKENESPSVGVQQGKFNQIDYGVVYRKDGQYSRELLTSPGEHVIFSSEQAKTFYTAAALRKALKSKITLSTDATGAERNRPWTDDLTPEQRAKFDEYLLSFAERATPAGTTGDEAGTNDGGSGAGPLDLRHGAIGRRIGGTVAYKQRDSEGPRRSQGNDQDGIRGLTAEEFAAVGKTNRESHPFGTSVDVYPAEDYANYDLILVERNGETATASISPDGEIGAVTKSNGADRSMVEAAFEAAIATGKVKWLNGFDTILPVLYAAKGFAPVARLRFAEDQKPEGWDFEAYQKFNNGRPDVVFMRYTGTPVEYRSGDGPLATSWDAAVAAVTRAPAAPAAPAPDATEGSMSVGPRRAVSAAEARIAELQRAIDAKYESGKLRGVLDMEDELETLLEEANSNQQGMEADAEEDVDRGSPDAASFLIDALARWNREDAGAYSTFGAFARRLTGDNEYVIDPGATDAEIEAAAKDATAEYERRRTAMRNVRMMGITDVVKAIRDGNTDTPLRAVNAVIEDATELRERVRAAAERRAQPRQTGKAAILDQIVRGMKSGKLDAPAGKAVIEFVNGLADATVEGTAVSMRSGKGVSSFDFGESLATLFYNQSNDAAQTAIHEFWHGLSRFLPTEEVDKMRADYQAALAKYLVKNPGFFALVGRYALLPEQFEDYSRLATPAELAQLQGYNARGAKVDNFSPDADHYKISFTPENYRYVMLDEWIAETMTDRVLDDQPVPDGFMGQMVAIFRRFWSTLKAAMGRDPYERFRQAVMGPDVRQVMWRDTPVEEARALWQSDKVATPFNQRYSSMSVGPRRDLMEMTPVMADSSAFPKEADGRQLRETGEVEYAKLVGPTWTNKRDGRQFRFTLQQFGKPRSHSADPRIMKLIPSLPSLMENAVLLETDSEIDPEKYRNIDAWHTYAARALLNGQPLVVQLSTFEQNGVEMVSLYHDHNVLSEAALNWGLQNKNGGSTQIGPTDPVTNRAVTSEALAKSKLFQLLAGDNSNPASSMSIGPRAKLDAVQARLDARLEKDPAARRKIAAEAARRLRKLETDWTTERLTWNGKINAIDEPRTKKSLDKEQAMRQAQFGKDAADEWRTGIDAKQKKDYSPRASLLRDMRTLDAIVGALPPEIRYQVGGQIKLAGLATDEARADEIARRIDRIAPLLERHLQKEFTASLEKLLERAEALNAKPGEKVTGKLGPEVQHLMDAVRKAYKLTAAQTEDALAALDSRLADPDLTPEQQALVERERELVNLVGGWRPEYTNSGRLDKLGRPIYTRVSEGASAAQMEAAYAAVEETYETGFQEWQAKILAKRLARQAIRTSLIGDTGKTGEAPERDAKALEELGWTAKLKNMFMSLSSFEEMLRYTFGMDSVQAIRLADQEREAAYTYEDAVQAMGDLVHAHFTAIGGDSLAGEKIRYALSQKDKTVGKRTLSEMEIMQAALMWQQKDGQRHMLGKLDESNMPIGTWHYDQAWMDEAMAQLSPEGLSTLAFIRSIYAAEYGPLNAMYRARHGVDLPQNANYAPVTVAPAQAKAGEMIDPVGGGTTTGSILTPGSLRTRSRTAIAEPDFKDALQVMLAHNKQMQHWMAYYDFAVEAQAVLGNRELGNAVEARAGAQGKLVLRKWIDVFAQGGTRDAGAALTMNVELGSATGRGARMALVGRVGTLLIQSTQLGAAIAEMPSGDYVYRFGKLMAGQMDWSAAMRSSYIQRRMLQAPPIVQQALAGLSSDNPTVVKHTVQRLGTLISGADALFTAGTYAMILDYQMGEAAKLGLTGPAAEAYAHKAAERSVERVAQPTRAGTRSLYENTATSPAGKLGWAFASEARQKVALAAWAAVNRKADPARAARVAMVVWGVGGLMAAILRNAWRDMRDDDDDTWMELAKKAARGDFKGIRDNVFDDRNWKLSQLVTSTIAGPLTGIPLIGEAMQSAIAVATGGWDSSGNLLSGLGKGVGSAVDLLSGEFLEADEPMEDVMKDAEAVLMMMGLFNENLASASSLAHVVRDGAAVVDGLYDTDKERLMKDAANQRKLEAAQDKAAKAAETKALTEEQQEALKEEAKNQRKAKKQAAREEAAAKWRAANP